MSYFVMKVYAFECDRPGCEEMTEVHPWAAAGRHLLTAAERELRSQGWEKNGTCYYCPEHKRED